MKTNILLLIVLSPFSLQLNAQKSELNWQDFMKSSKTTQIANPVQIGNFTTFQITNINKFLYKVEIEGKVFELQTPIPTELQTLFRLKQEDLDKRAGIIKSKEAVDEVSDAIPPMEDVEKKANEKKKEVEQTILQSESDLLTAQNVVAVTKSAKSLKAQKIKEKEQAVEVAKKIKVSQSQLAASAEEVVLECTKYLELARQVANDVFALKQTRNKFISIAQMDVAEARIKDMVSGITWPITDIENHYIELQELYKQLELRYSELSAKAEAAGLNDDDNEKIDNSLEKVEKANDLIEQDALLGLLADVDFLYNELNNPNNFKAVAPPVQMDEDIVSYTVNISPAPTRTLGAFRSPMNFKFNIPTKGGLKVDFSAGPVISFGKKARDEKYFLEETVKSDTVILRQRSNNNVIAPSIAAMMHFYARGKHIGGMMGIGAGFQSSSEINANLFAGASYIIGKKEKLMLSAGLSYLRVDRLKDQEFVAGNEYNSAKIKLENVTEKVFKPSFFLSISYNLTNKVEIN